MVKPILRNRVVAQIEFIADYDGHRAGETMELTEETRRFVDLNAARVIAAQPEPDSD